MDLFSILFLSSVSVFFGVILTLVLQYYVILKYFNKSPLAEKPRRINEEAYSLPEALKKEIESDVKSPDASISISLMLQFLFHELRHSQAVKRWLHKKLSLEFDELLTKTTIGKFFDSVKIRDMNLGTQFPDIKNIALEDIQLDKNDGHIDTLNLSVNLDYTGNFLLSVDANMKFGKTAYLSIKVKKISGTARLQFTRSPYTHWSFSFYNDPIIELAVESHFQGRQLQSNITNLIVNQIKKAIRRKHTLPNYKIRYKPFFVKMDPGQHDTDDEVVLQGQLEVTCVEVSRLATSPDILNVYCTFTVDSLPFISLFMRDNNTCLILELTMTKVRQQHLGVIFKQEQAYVIVDSVSPQTPAFAAGLKPGDVIIAIENRNVTNVTQVPKFIKSISGVNITLRIERIVNDYIFKSKYVDKNEQKNSETKNSETNSVEDLDIEESVEVLENLEPAKKTKSMHNIDRIKSDKPESKVPKILSASNENMSKFAQTIGNFALRKRKASVGQASNDSSTKTTPTPSSPGTPQHAVKQHLITVPSNLLLTKKHSISEVPEIVRTDLDTQDVEVLSCVVECQKGKELLLNSIMSFNDEYCFNLKDNQKYLNVNVWGTTTSGKDVLLGYTNIPLNEILSECCDSMLGHYIRAYSFLPPSNIPPTNVSHPLMSHSGFEHVFCYGDILLSFVWNHDEEIVEIIKPKITTNNVDVDTKPHDAVSTAKHDFVRTQFHRTTHCDFCTKKIWLKDAVQCRQCGLCCHKKCISKCQVSTECVPNDVVHLKSENIELVQPDLRDGIDDLSVDTESSGDSKQSFSLKRVNSANNLAIPGAHVSTCQSRSLPPSPQHTPSRKQSLVETNPFILCPTALDDVQKNPGDAGDCVAQLLDHILLSPSDESLMDAAKETGKQLYAGMQPDEKIEKINIMMGELKKVFDTVTSEHSQLSRRLSIEESEVEKAKLAFLIGQADAKMHAISALMLHYCSGLQQSQEKIV